VYARFVRQHVRTVLEKNFTVLAELLPPARWNQLVDGYFTSQPSHHWELNANAEAFPDFVLQQASLPGSALTGLHAELALLEWQEFVVFTAPDRWPTAPAGRWVLNPTLALLQFSFPVSAFVTAWRASPPEHRPAPPDEEAPETVMLFRHPETERVVFHRADEPLLFAFKVAHDGLSPEQAAQATGLGVEEVVERLSRASQLGLVQCR
jgi:hypothetical protein